MSYSVSGTMITLTRGDTFSALITITDLNDNQYIPMNGDRIRFAMKNDYNDETPLLIKEIPIDTMILTLNPEDTKHLPFAYTLAQKASNYGIFCFYNRNLSRSNHF